MKTFLHRMIPVLIILIIVTALLGPVLWDMAYHRNPERCYRVVQIDDQFIVQRYRELGSWYSEGGYILNLYDASSKKSACDYCRDLIQFAKDERGREKHREQERERREREMKIVNCLDCP